MITKIRIRRFRSIDDMTIDCGRFTILVGPNDAGKSNIARALNLFFNGETDPGVPYNFESDYNKESFVGVNKVQEIIIEMTFKLPKSFLENDSREEVMWRKVWRRAGIHDKGAVIRYMKARYNKRVLPDITRIPQHLNAHNLTYTPAIKDKEFFANLMGTLYDASRESLTEEPSLSGGIDFFEFSPLMDSLGKIFNQKFTVSLPQNLRPIYENLTIKNEKGIPFDRRGDGIKIRHIPEFLEKISEEIDKRPGIVPSHMWVFEEPENNLEFNASFDMIKRLQDIMDKNDKIQMVITTHSPIFYNVGFNLDSKMVERRFVASEDNEKGKTFSVVKNPDTGDIDERMGLFLIFDDKVKDAIKKSDEASRNADEMRKHWEKNGQDLSKSYIFAEGKSDEIIYTKALEVFFPQHAKDIKVKSPLEGGYKNVAACLHAWHLMQNTLPKSERVKSCAIFDGDEKSQEAKKELSTLIVKDFKFIKSFSVDVTDITQEIFKKGYKTPKDLESLYSDEVWKYGQTQKGFLKKISQEELIKEKRLPENVVSEIMQNKGEIVSQWDELTTEQKIRVSHRFHNHYKVKIANWIVNHSDDDIKRMLTSTQDILQKCIKWLTDKDPQEKLDIDD